MKYTKCIVWDLDNTIWDGVLLEDSEVILKPGIAEILKTLDSRGILHSIASKNEHDDAMKQLKKFRIDHFFLYPQINWNLKSESIKEIKDCLNIGYDSMMFVDDQEFELEEVKMALPMVQTFNSGDYRELARMASLSPKTITEDSKRRRQMYLEDAKRAAYEKEYRGPSAEFMESLKMEFVISAATDEDLLRVEELSARTNQLNSTGVQYSYEQLKKFVHSPRHQLWICELSDRYGSYGKIGLTLLEIKDQTIAIQLLLMSCRTMSRGVGSILLSFIMKKAKEEQKKLEAEFRRTGKNRQMLITYQFANFKESRQEGDITILENDLEIIQEYPPYVKVRIIGRKQPVLSV